MIVKIWPVKGTQGTKKAKLYIEDARKVIKIEMDEKGKVDERLVIDPQQELHQDVDRFFIEKEEDLSRVVNYMANEDKTENKYISGYRCDAETALGDFEDTRMQVIRQTGTHKNVENKERENMAFHIVQSFPEEIDISDEEVHQCGLELLEKIGKHQGIVCSHVHPVVDEEGEVHGLCKHNHILLNAYMMPSEIDPNNPEIIKYNDCQSTYAQLQIWNDEIAIDHGLPIIRDPDLERTYSWFENNEAKKGRSFKERMRLDIEAARRISSNWQEFVAAMKETGYQIREGKYVTYTAPDGHSKSRDFRLGRAYTKESLELHWTLRNRIERDVETAARNNEAPPLWEVAQKHGALRVEVPLGIARDEEDGPSYLLPLDKTDRSREVLSTYFNDKDLYHIRDVNGKVVANATGREVIDYMESLKREEQERWAQERKRREEEQRRHQEEEEEKRRQESEKEEKKKTEYYSSSFRNSRSGKKYRVNIFDEDGRLRSRLEIILLLASVVLKNEDGLWNYYMPLEKENEVMYASTEKKIQNLMDSIHIATEEGIHSPEELDLRLHQIGAEYSRARSALQKTKKSQEKMEALHNALKDYDETREMAERILAIPEGAEKEQLKEQYAEELERFKKAKAVMYGYKVTTQGEIDDFRERYADIMANLPQMQAEFDRTKEEYRKMKKVHYSLTLAQNAQFCYGPAYDEKTAFDWVERGQFEDLRPSEQDKEKST